MTGYEFIAEMTGALAWPTAAVIVAVVFRKQISALFDREKGTLSLGPFTVAWEGWERAVRADLPKSDRAATAVPSALGVSTVEELLPVIEASPGAAVTEGFRRVEVGLQRRLGDEVAPSAHLPKRIREAESQGLITAETARAINGLRVMRNLAVHGGGEQLTREQAIEFLTLVDAVLFALAEKE